MKKHAYIISGGLSGLSTAWQLHKAFPDWQITVLEADERLGGKIQSSSEEGFLYEHGPNGFLNNRQETLDLCYELGLKHQIIEANQAAEKRFIYRGGKLHELKPSPSILFKMSLLSFKGRMSFFKDLFVKAEKRDDETLDSFARRHFGDEIADYIFDPFCSGIFGSSSQQLSVRSSFPSLFEVDQEYGSIIRGMIKKKKAKKSETKEKKKKSKLCSFRFGMQQIIEALETKLKQAGVTLLTSSPVSQVGKKQLTYTEKGEEKTVEADIIISAAPSYALAKLCAENYPKISEACADIPYTPMAVQISGFEKMDHEIFNSSFGYLVPSSESPKNLGRLFSSSLYPERFTGGRALCRTMIGGAKWPEATDQSTATLEKTVQDELKETLGIATKPCFSRSIYWPQAIPIYLLGHYQIVETIEEETKDHSLFITGNAFYGVSMNDCIRASHECVQKIQSYVDQACK